MKIVPKVIISFILLSLIFFLLRIYGQQAYYNVGVLVADLGGLTYLYSTVGIIFAIFAASIIIFESQRWDNIIDSIKGEVSELHELWQWSRHAADPLKQEIGAITEEYLRLLVNNVKNRIVLDNPDTERLVSSLRASIVQVAKESSYLASNLFIIFDNFIEYRTKRINYSTYHISKTLQSILLLNTILLIVLSFLIGVRNIWLDYIFLMSVSMLSSAIYFVIDDMDSPTQVGSWYIKGYDYQNLLEKICAQSERS